MRTGPLGLTLCLGLLCAAQAGAEPLKLSTWNLNWLTQRPAGDPLVPSDVGRRGPEDFAKLAAYAARLAPDIAALEEVDGPDMAARLFPPDRYRIVMTDDLVAQRVGLAVRRDLSVTINPELRDLNAYGSQAPHPLRGGLDVTVSDGRASLRILAVHLKTGCWEPKTKGRGTACETLAKQFAVLDDWVLERQDEGEAFAVLGDFNRRLTPRDPLETELAAEGPLTLATTGRASPCWGGEYFIDHILLGGAARAWLVPDSLSVLVYRERDRAEQETLSDHCPVSVRLGMP